MGRHVYDVIIFQKLGFNVSLWSPVLLEVKQHSSISISPSSFFPSLSPLSSLNEVLIDRVELYLAGHHLSSLSSAPFRIFIVWVCIPRLFRYSTALLGCCDKNFLTMMDSFIDISERTTDYCDTFVISVWCPHIWVVLFCTGCEIGWPLTLLIGFHKQFMVMLAKIENVMVSQNPICTALFLRPSPVHFWGKEFYGKLQPHSPFSACVLCLLVYPACMRLKTFFFFFAALSSTSTDPLICGRRCVILKKLYGAI